MALTPLAIRLRELRESRSLTQQDIGTYLNISRQGYSHYENGTRVPDFHTLDRLASLYGLTIDNLLTFHSEKYSFSEAAVAEDSGEIPSQALKGLTRQEQWLLNLFSELSPEEKEDFMDLLFIKYNQYQISKNTKEGN